MHIENVTINVSGGPSAISRAFIEALLRGPELNEPGDQPAAAPEPTAVALAQPPRIGEIWSEQGGIYAGISRGEDGAPDGHLVLLDALPGKDLNWPDAIKWAEGLGDGARLPTRFESALLYANIQDKIEKGDWYWTGTQYSDNYAWGQDFLYGNQYYDLKSSERRARAVRRLAL